MEWMASGTWESRRTVDNESWSLVFIFSELEMAATE